MDKKLPGRIWRVVYPALLLFGAYFAVYIVAILTYGTFFSSQYDTIESFMSAAGDIISGAALVAGGLAVYYIYRKDYVVSGKWLFNTPKYLIFTILFAILSCHGLSILVSLVNYSGLLGTYTQTATMLSTSGLIITIFKSVILVPLAEEVTFRGLVFRRMELYTSFWPAALVSAALFGLYHMNLLQGIYAFLYGILLCLVYRIFRNLWATIAMHAAANAFSVLFQYSGLDYPSVPVYCAVMTACLAGAAAIYLLILKKAD